MRVKSIAVFGLTIAIIMLVFNAVLYAADSTNIIELDKMVVREKRSTVFSSDIIDSTALALPQDSKTVDGLLVNLAGIDVQRTSPSSGKGRGVTIRGFSESQSLIMLNGRPLNGAGVMGGDYVDWSSLSIDDVKEIEVIRGAKSAEYGNTLGGVINIITKRDMQSPAKTKINLSYGIVSPEHAKDAFENRATDISIVHHANILDVAALDLFAGYAQGEPFLRNNGFKRSNFGGELSVMLPMKIKATAGLRSTIQYRGFAIANEVGSPYYNSKFPESEESAGGGPGLAWKGGDYYFGDRSYWKNIRKQIDFSLQKEFKSLLLSAQVYINDQDRTEYFYAITDTNNLVLERFAKPEDYTWGWNIKANQSIKEKHTLSYGFEGISLRYNNSDIKHCNSAYFRFPPSDYGNPDETIRAADRYSAFIQTFFNLGERFEVTPGVRYDYYIGTKQDTTVDKTPRHGVSPNTGVAVKIWKGGEVTLHGAYAYRFPTCPELYWYYGGYQPGERKELSPERSVQSELGLVQSFSISEKFNGSAGVRGYYYPVYDYIRTIFGYRPSRLIYNIDKVNLYGFEIECAFDFLEVLSIRGNYTFQVTEKTGDTFDSSMALTDGLPELPRHKGNFGIEYNAPNGATVGLAMRLVGEKDVIEGNPAMGNATTLRHLDAFAAFRLYGSYPLLSKGKYSAKAKLGIDNLFNTDYEEEPGIPMPGITTTGSIEVTF